MALWRGFLGVNAKNPTCSDWMKAVPVTDQSYVLQLRSAAFHAGSDAPSQLRESMRFASPQVVIEEAV
jgi:hypothetical protein